MLNTMTNLIDEPVFLVGSERSGTTLLRLMLDHHPELALNLESEYMVTGIADDGTFPDMAAYREFLASSRVFGHSHFAIDDRLGFKELLNDFLNQKRLRDGKSRVGATVHYQFRKLGLVWLDAKYIYLYRDGRDVANSVMKMGWAGNLYCAADAWLEAETEWEELKRSLADERWLEVRFEQLTADPRHELQRVCRFLGVSYSERMFDYVHRSSYQMPDSSMNYQWKAKLKDSDIQLLEAKLGEALQQRGYGLSGLQPIAVGGCRRTLLKLDSRCRTYLFRLRRYGLLLSLGETLSRRLGFNDSHKRLVRAISAIDDAYLR